MAIPVSPVADRRRRARAVDRDAANGPPIKGIYAVICTYNRRQLVARCVGAIVQQTEPPDGIILFDNASTDGTEAHLGKQDWPSHPPIHYFRTDRNLGCAGGFRRALELAVTLGAEWAWIMDDDTIVEPDTLAELKRACSTHFDDADGPGFITSRVVTPDGEPNNVQLVDDRIDQHGYIRWSEHLADGLVRVRWTSLNATLIPREMLLRHGGPSPDFVIWGDDIDFTSRIAAERPCYVAGRALAVHHTTARGQLSVLNEGDPQRIRNLFFHFRNGVYIRRTHYGTLRAFLFIGKSLIEAARCLTRQQSALRIRAIVTGLLAGCIFRPRYPPLDATAPIREAYQVLQRRDHPTPRTASPPETISPATPSAPADMVGARAK